MWCGSFRHSDQLCYVLQGSSNSKQPPSLSPNGPSEKHKRKLERARQQQGDERRDTCDRLRRRLRLKLARRVVPAPGDEMSEERQLWGAPPSQPRGPRWRRPRRHRRRSSAKKQRKKSKRRKQKSKTKHHHSIIDKQVCKTYSKSHWSGSILLA